MALALLLDSLDGVAEALKPMYVAHEGKFRLDVDGVEDVSGLKSALQKERDAAKLAQAELKKYAGVDPDKYKGLLAHIENDAEAKLIAEGKISEVIANRTTKQREESDRLVKEATEKVAAAEKRAMAFQGRVLDDAIRQAAGAAGLHKHAIDDALFRGRSLFTLDENGKAIQVGSDGEPVLGKDGKTPFTPAEWLESMKEHAPHWYPVSNSGSSASGKAGVAGGKDLSHLPPTERLTAARAAQAGRK